MLKNPSLLAVLVLGFSISGIAQNQQDSKPVELEVLKAFVGVWDAEIEVWPAGLDKPSIKMKAVETNTAHGEYWVSSDFESEYEGQKVKVHSIVGYDLDKKKLVGTMVDHGPYAATMAGEYDKQTKTVTWMIKAKLPNGSPMVQKSMITQKNANERLLVLTMPGEKQGEFNKFMEIKFVKRKK